MTTTILDQWAADWSIPVVALHDLRHRLSPEVAPPEGHDAGWSEARVTQEVRFEAGEKGVLLWRNNVGAYQDEHGRWVRYGILNDSKALNEKFKSSDFLGMRKRLILPQHVPPQGLLIGQFVAREMKHANWKWSGTDREVAQRNFIDLVNANGGDAAFANSRGTL